MFLTTKGCDVEWCFSCHILCINIRAIFYEFLRNIQMACLKKNYEFFLNFVGIRKIFTHANTKMNRCPFQMVWYIYVNIFVQKNIDNIAPTLKKQSLYILVSSKKFNFSHSNFVAQNSPFKTAIEIGASP